MAAQATRFDRRKFVQGGAMVGSAWWAAAAQAQSPQAQSANESTGDQPASPAAAADVSSGTEARRVVVGVMGMSRGLALAETIATLPQVEIRYVCDVDRERLERAMGALAPKLTQPPQPINDFRRMLDDPHVDALICAAPNHWHGPATLWAAAAGKHTYVEKPCCHNPQEGEWMVAAAQRRKLLVQMGTQRRSSPGTIAAIRELRAGRIGRVYLARGWYSNRRGSIGRGQTADVPGRLDFDLWQGPAPRRTYVDNLVHYNWHWRWHWGNGELGNNGVHALDLCRWGLDVTYPTRVTSSGGRYVFADDQETPDTHTVNFEFPDRKAISWHGLSCNSFDGAWVVFYGDQGTLDLRVDGTYTVYDLQGAKIGEGEQADAGERLHLLNFVNAIRADNAQQLACEITDGHRTTLLCHLGNMAQRVGESLQCDPANGHIVGNSAALQYWGREYEPRWEPPRDSS